MGREITAAEIREIRQGYGLSQRSFAALLGIGLSSIVRYEQGVQPSKANANLIRAARNPDFMWECLEADGGLVPATQRNRAQQVVYSVVTLDSDEGGKSKKRKKKEAANFSKGSGKALGRRRKELSERAATAMGEIVALQMEGQPASGAADALGRLLDQVAALKKEVPAMRDPARFDYAEGYLQCALDLLTGK